MRLFVAVDPPAQVRAAIAEAIDRCRALAPDAKWQRPDALHLTLAFLGHLPDERVPAVGAALAAVAPRHRPLALAAAAAGSFGPRTHPRVLFLEVGGDVEGLARLQAEVEASLRPLGHEPEARPFHPHLTLARARAPGGDRALAAAREALAGAAPMPFVVGELVLYRSDLSPHGARYTPLATVPFGGG